MIHACVCMCGRCMCGRLKDVMIFGKRKDPLDFSLDVSMSSHFAAPFLFQIYQRQKYIK